MSGGRGGDLWKARKHRPREILIADLDGKALETAKDRWSKRRNPRRDDPVLRKCVYILTLTFLSWLYKETWSDPKK